MSRDRDIAIVGMAGRFPGARDLDEFWANVRDGVESVSFFTDEQLLAAGAAPDHLDQPNFVRAGACLPGIDMFDAEFFGYTAREAEIMDPQHRVFLETAWQALEHSGHDPARFDGDIGVFAGAGSNGYLAHVYSHPEIVETTGGTQILLGNELGFLSTRVSYKLDLRGPSVSLRTACSTSLVAVHLACRSLRERECDMALSGGVFLNLEQERGYFHQEGSFVSPDGHCRPFDARAAGTLFGSGAGAVVLKRLDDALADGDTVYAVIKGSAVNNDGAVKVGFTAPTVAGQARVIADALRDAGTDPAAIGYVEAHGTGTSLGDPIEVRALTKAYEGVPPATVALGSLKSNFGHLDAAAGIAGLIKTVLAMWHETLPRTLHFQSPNPDIDFAAGPFTVQRDTAPWPRSGKPRLAGVSAFGFGGTNAHVVLQEGPPQGRPDAGEDARPDEHPSHLLVLSARNHAALEELSDAMAARLRRGPARLTDVTYTAATGRHRFPVRRAVTGPDAASLAAALEARDPARVTTGECGGTPPRVAFLLSGQGGQYPGMARELYAHEPVFRDAVDLCLKELASRGDADAGLLDLLLDAERSETAAAELDRTRLAQPALFVLEFALARLWASWGVEPAALLGHSLGELVAACLAGVFTPQDALALVALRGRLMQEQPTGAMLSVVADRATVESLLPGDVFLAAHNGPKDCVVSGGHTAVAAFAALLSERGVATRPVSTSHAFHSPMMQPMVDRFVAAVAAVPRQAPRTRFVSNTTGTWITDDEARDPAYWGRHVLAPVEFDAGVRTLAEEPDLVFLEVGPGQTLTSLARRVVTGEAPRLVTSTLPHRQDKRHPVEAAQRALGQLWLAGGEPDWAAFHEPRQGGRRRRVALPTYPFQGKRYWLDRQAEPAARTPAARRAAVADWIQAPSWERTVLPQAPASPTDRCWLVFDDGRGLAEALTARLRRDGARVTTVSAGDQWTQAPGRFTIDPVDPDHYTRLLRALREQDQLPTRIAHCWNVTGATPGPDGGPAAGFAAARRAFDGLLLLAQALNSHSDQPDCDIWVVSDGLHRVLGTERLMPLKSTLLGPVRVIPREHPGLACRSVDIVLDGEPVERAADQLLREFSVPPGHAAVAYRGPHRWSQTYVPAPLPPSDSTPSALRDDGVYLITGGTGGLGLALAEHLARPGRRLALLARTPVPPEEEWDRRLAQPDGGRITEVIEKVRAIRRRGAEVMLLTADVCDHDQVEAAVSAVVGRWGGVHGAFHAAGLAGGGLVQLGTPEKAAQVMGPKVLGTLHLEQALADRWPDFLFLFGSNAAHVGDFGLADYVAANSFLDAYAHSHAAERRVLTVDWGPWKDAGMAVATDLPDALAEIRGKDVAERGMASAQALEALERVLSSSPEPQLIVSPVDVNALIEQAFVLGADAGGDERLAGLGAPHTLHPRPEVPSAYAPPKGETQRQLCKAWQDLLGIDQVGVNDSFFDLGGGSLIAIQLVATVNKSLGASLTVAQLYEVLTVAGLARLIDGDDAEPAEAAGHTIEQVKSRAHSRRQHQQNRMARARARRQT
ncbi:type I polyketide synthase [Streptomyces sp. FXY-T5]|uniref:type I polyketide synthase n=1 Tax=Streptomyces sp. FXY-T5 TaxID=3064901 RepID=UPI0027D1F8B2|nr:type I polyketide synthase [Streptomyces sp. FXY-T5]WMD07318.1 SDR family NAD(P)-dependent oxidoreductase [Streptomyces sp. FXY-T5]